MKAQHYSIPLTSTLIAFEAVARNMSVSRAATELNTSQSAISRHLRNLEDALGVKLLERTGRGMSLTDSGRAYFHAVQRSMNDLEATAHELRTRRTRLTITCTSEISTLVLLPVFFRLKRFLGEEISVEVAVHDGLSRDRFGPRMPDIVFDGTPSATAPGPDAVKMLDEEIVPVASPEFVERFGSVLSQSPSHWSTVPRLEVSERNRGWAGWNDWFHAHGCTAPEAPVDVFEDYAHLLRAAAEGGGLAVGRNGLLNDYVVDGRLVAIRDSWLRTGLSLFAAPTQYGKRNRASQGCLKELSKLVAELRQLTPSMRAKEFASSAAFASTLA
ncbi:MAG: LysR family transcriptional regulator [bacterium]|nr:LysR family transcriptional regulator [bacterium]